MSKSIQMNWNVTAVTHRFANVSNKGFNKLSGTECVFAMCYVLVWLK